MAQYPSAGAAKRDTVISDHLIEDLTTTVSDSETGETLLEKQHRDIPAVVVVNNQTNTAAHVNLYLTAVTNIANWATGSITIAGGTTALDLNGDTFTLIDKDTTSQVFTFNNTDNVVTDGSIGLLTATDELTIITRTKTSINNISSLDITAGTITEGSTASATAVNAIDTTGLNRASSPSLIQFSIPSSIGGENDSQVTYILINNADDTGAGPAAGNTIGIGIDTGSVTEAQIAAAIIAAINGTSHARVTAADSGVGASANGNVLGITAEQGASDTQITLTTDVYGPTGNITNGVVLTSGVDIVDVEDFTGGLATQTLQVIQDITGSTGNTTINMAGVTGGSSTNFVDGNNYGKITFAASESFTGSVRLRAVSLQNDYLM